MVWLVGVYLVWSLYVLLAGSLGDFLFLLLLFCRQCLLLFTMTHISMTEICSIPYEFCLAQRYMFCLYFFVGVIVVGHRLSYMHPLAPPIVSSSHRLYQTWINTMVLCF